MRVWFLIAMASVLMGGTVVLADASTITVEQQIAHIARAQVGKKYQYGAVGPEAFDCSGLVVYSYQQAGHPADMRGTPIGRTTHALAQQGEATNCTLDDLDGSNTVCWQAGDVAVYRGHVALYVGDGQFVDAQNVQHGVVLHTPDSQWYRQRWLGARRYLVP